MKAFASDNYSSVSPEILEFLLQEVNKGHQRAYGNDDYSHQAAEIIKQVLGREDAEVHFVLTGTGSNILSINSLIDRTESVFVPISSHINANEAGGPEGFTQSKIIAVPEIHGKIDLPKTEEIIIQEDENMPHSPKPGIVSIAESTEYGTVYTCEELKSIRDLCTRYDMRFHMDCCRMYNAAVALHCELKDIIDAGNPDVISLGGTKNGLMSAEAVIFLNRNKKPNFEIRQKQATQLYSKMRFASAQFIPYFKNDLWRKNATQANTVCMYLYQQLQDFSEISFTHPVETNHIFAILPKEVIEPLQEEFPFYIWTLATNEVRFVTSFDNTHEEVDAFILKLKNLLAK